MSTRTIASSYQRKHLFDHKFTVMENQMKVLNRFDMNAGTLYLDLI